VFALRWKQVHVVKIADVPKERAIGPLFTSAEVFTQPLSPEGSQFASRVVTFGAGTRNKLHTHSSAQVLIVTQGKGFVATESEQREVIVGDVIFFAAGEPHWHGAGPDSEFAHIYVTLAGASGHQVGK
jgi:quercetin dioxygenase-like cupin family protein